MTQPSDQQTLEEYLLQTETKVIKREMLTQATHGMTIISHARRQAAQHLRAARAQGIVIKEKEKQKAIEQAQMQMAEQMMTTAARSVDYINHLEDSVTELVMDALQKILDDMDQGDKVRAIVRKALKMMRDHERIRLRVAKEDEAALQKEITDANFVEIVRDSSMARGSVILESDLGVLDASLDVQLAAIRNSLGHLFGRHDDA